LIAAALLLAAATVAAPQDRDYRAALDVFYDGRAAEAQARLAVLQGEHPEDPVPAYLQALLLAWMVEQAPQDAAVDRAFTEAADRAWAVADALVRADPADARARFARGAASGVRSRYHLFRLHRAEAARTAAQMREDLLVARDRDPDDADVLFGLGLYDYYVDVLPRYARVLRFLSRLPGGDRRRGLHAIEEASRTSRLHAVEARVQLYEIHAFYEGAADEAAEDMEAMCRRYPGWPLWGLKLAEHLRDRLGAYAESEAAARAVLRGGPDAPEAGARAMAMARLSLGESLLLDLEPEEARRAVQAVLAARDLDAPALVARAFLIAGRSLELEGDREGAAEHYRRAAAGAEGEWRRRAEAALAHPLPADERDGRRLLGQARRARADGHAEAAAAAARDALARWPASREAALGVAEYELRAGRAHDARVPEIDEPRDGEPAWLVPWSRLLRAQRADLLGQRADAVELYKQVYAAAHRRLDLRATAAAGMREPFRAGGGASPPPHAVRQGRTALPTAQQAGFLAISRFSTPPSTG
jgi:hypothetical protein